MIAIDGVVNTERRKQPSVNGKFALRSDVCRLISAWLAVSVDSPEFHHEYSDILFAQNVMTSS